MSTHYQKHSVAPVAASTADPSELNYVKYGCVAAHAFRKDTK